MLQKLLTDASLALLPRHCLVCHSILKSSEPLCLACAPRQMHYQDFQRCLSCHEESEYEICGPCSNFAKPWRKARYLWRYHGVARDYIKVMKYEYRDRLLVNASEQLMAALPKLFSTNPASEWDVIVPIPSTFNARRGSRRLMRIAALIAHRSKLQSSSALEFVDVRSTTRSHTATSPAQRLLLAKTRAFRVTARVEGARVLLLDDVSTTGVTMSLAAQSLLQAGAASIDLLSLSRSTAWQTYRAQCVAAARDI